MSVDLDVLKRCLDNTAPISRYNDLGLFYYAKRFFPDQFSLPFGKIHYQLSSLMFSCYEPSLVTRMERQRFAMVFRGAAKTTLGTFLIPLYNIHFKGMTTHARVYRDGWEGGTGVNTSDIISYRVGEDFMLVISETASSAENFVMNIKTIIDNRVDLIEWFGDKHPEALELDKEVTRRGELMWRKNAFITSDRTIVYGIGSGQQVRGRNVLNYRPTLAIVDDMYSEKNTKTEEARRKLDQWFYSAMKNSVDIRRGKVVLLGTMVHADTVFKDIRGSDQWLGMSVPVIGEEDLEKALTYCQKKANKLIIPDKSSCSAIEKELTTLAFASQYNLYSILSLYKEAYEKQNIAYFYQEYMNIIKIDDERSITKKAFIETKMRLVMHGGQRVLEVIHNGRIWRSISALYVGVDIASSQKAKSDDTAIAIVGYGKFESEIIGTDKKEYMTRPFIYELIGGKYGIYDADIGGRHIEGWVNKLEGITRTLAPEMITVEIAGQAETMFNEAYNYMRKTGLSVAMKPETVSNQMKKEERILSILLPVVQKHGEIFMNENATRKEFLYSQLEFLGSDGIHDDYPDALAYAFLYAREPMQSILAPYEQASSYKPRKFRANSWETM